MMYTFKQYITLLLAPLFHATIRAIFFMFNGNHCIFGTYTFYESDVDYSLLLHPINPDFHTYVQ
jgi:hypothetical protein